MSVARAVVRGEGGNARTDTVAENCRTDSSTTRDEEFEQIKFRCHMFARWLGFSRYHIRLWCYSASCDDGISFFNVISVVLAITASLSTLPEGVYLFAVANSRIAFVDALRYCE